MLPENPSHRGSIHLCLSLTGSGLGFSKQAAKSDAASDVLNSLLGRPEDAKLLVALVVGPDGPADEELRWAQRQTAVHVAIRSFKSSPACDGKFS